MPSRSEHLRIAVRPLIFSSLLRVALSPPPLTFTPPPLHSIINDLGIIGELPTALGRLTALKKLHMHVNKISGTIPFTIGALTALRDLQLWGNQLTGPLPSSMGLMTTLKLLGLHYNLLTGALKQFCPLIAQFEGKTCSLGQKVGTFNGFPYTKTWSDSNQCSNCMSNARVGEGGCDFANGGTAPSDWEYQIPVPCTNVDPNPTCPNNQMAECAEYIACQSNVAGCTALNLERRGLIGALPDTIGLLTALERLYINGNALSGTITDEIKKLTSLKTLWVQNNKFAGAASGICTVAPTITEGCFLGRNPLWVDGAQCPACLNIGNCHQDHTGMAALPVVCTTSSSATTLDPTPSPTVHPTLQPTPSLGNLDSKGSEKLASVEPPLAIIISLVALVIAGIVFTLLLTFGTVVFVTVLIKRSNAAGRASAAATSEVEMHGNSETVEEVGRCSIIRFRLHYSYQVHECKLLFDALKTD